jgi:sorting nexin-27
MDTEKKSIINEELSRNSIYANLSKDDENQFIRKINLKKSDSGFGFNVRGQVSEGGPVKLFKNQFFAPLQQVSAVLKNGAADKAGLICGDRIIEVNGVNVEGASHKQVVDLIKSGGEDLVLIVLTIKNETAKSENSNINFSEKLNVSVEIKDFKEDISSNGEKFVSYNIYLSGTLVSTRRFKEFHLFNTMLNKIFPKYNFPSLPSKWPFKLNKDQIESRRQSLQNYLQEICSIKFFFENEIVKDFLCLNDRILNNTFQISTQNESPNKTFFENLTIQDTDSCTKRKSEIERCEKIDIGSKNFTLEVLTPDKSLVSLEVHKEISTKDAYMVN